MMLRSHVGRFCMKLQIETLFRHVKCARVLPAFVAPNISLHRRHFHGGRAFWPQQRSFLIHLKAISFCFFQTLAANFSLRPEAAI
jgi:hypothetical protein